MMRKGRPRSFVPCLARHLPQNVPDSQGSPLKTWRWSVKVMVMLARSPRSSPRLTVAGEMSRFWIEGIASNSIGR
jgi:hypothetical protein